MKKILSLLITAWLVSSSVVNAQKYLEITNLKNSKTFIIRRNSLIQCRYLAYKQYALLATGTVHQITDSTLIYSTTSFSPKREIKLSSITNIDKIMVHRIIVPALVSGAVFGETSILFYPPKTQDVAGLIGSVATLLPVLYVLRVNHRHLNKNKVGETVSMAVKINRDESSGFDVLY